MTLIFFKSLSFSETCLYNKAFIRANICFPGFTVSCVDRSTVCVCWRVTLVCLCDVAAVKECVENLSQEEDKENLVASLWGAERCLRVLESVSTASSNWTLTSIKVTVETNSRAEQLSTERLRTSAVV